MSSHTYFENAVRVRYRAPTCFRGQLYSLFFRGDDNVSEPVQREMAEQYVRSAPQLLEIVEPPPVQMEPEGGAEAQAAEKDLEKLQEMLDQIPAAVDIQEESLEGDTEQPDAPEETESATEDPVQQAAPTEGDPPQPAVAPEKPATPPKPPRLPHLPRQTAQRTGKPR